MKLEIIIVVAVATDVMGSNEKNMYKIWTDHALYIQAVLYRTMYYFSRYLFIDPFVTDILSSVAQSLK